MALTRCTECGNIVSDKAPYCPHCGAPLGDAATPSPNNDNTQIISTPPPPDNSSFPISPIPPSQPPYGLGTPDPKWDPAPRKKSNAGLWVVIIVLVVAITLLVLYFTVFDKGKSFSAEEVRDTIELQDTNSEAITKAVVDEERVKKENLTYMSPDLAFFNLHGHVSDITYKVDGYPIVELLGKTVKLDRDGRWTNYSILGKSAKVERDQNGYITHIFLHNSRVGDKNYYFQWSGGHMSGIEFYDNENSSQKTVRFHGDRVESKSGSTTQTYGCNDNSTTAYSGFKTDKYGNWTSCKWKRTGYEDCGWGQESISKSGHITRYLTYYDSF